MSTARMRVGYACINTELRAPNRTCRLANATPERILELGRANLEALRAILAWNAAHGIRLFRLTSDLIPFGSHPVNPLPWWDLLAEEFAACAALIRQTGQRVSLHPGQYTVLNSPRPEVVTNSRAELIYHVRLLEALETDRSHKIVLHLGGVYGDRQAALQRLAVVYVSLPEAVQARLVFENDERSYTLADALNLHEDIGAPVIFDVFHHRWNPSLQSLTLSEQVELAAHTWQPADGPPKLHYSDQWPGKPPGAHSATLDLAAFAEFVRQLPPRPLDIMLEVKDKEQSALAAQAYLAGAPICVDSPPAIE
jgi:UV DNA damage endonuclease